MKPGERAAAILVAGLGFANVNVVRLWADTVAVKQADDGPTPLEVLETQRKERLRQQLGKKRSRWR